jgi:hypothetical protein
MVKKLVLIGSAIAMLSVASAVGAATRTHDTELVANKGDKKLLIETDAGAVTYTSSGGQVTGSGIMSINSTWTGFLVATFTAESNCTGAAGGWCSIVINCDGVELQPAVGTDFAFDSVGPTSSTGNFHSLSVARRSNAFTGGTHSCEVRESLLNGATAFRVDDWIFQFEFWRQ